MRDGIDFYTHKAGEGLYVYRDREYGQSLNNARDLAVPILGAYFVNHPGDQASQADWFVDIVTQDTPWWRDHPCFIWQIDAEKFDYMDRAPNMAEIAAFGDRLVQAHGIDRRRVLAYAPQWLYGNSLTGLGYRLWASAYGGNPVAHYRDAYPGDDDGKRWQDYSGQDPLILQYGSNTTIGDQTTCDANAYRGTLDQLLAELGAGRDQEIRPGGVFDQPDDDEDEENTMAKGIIVQREGQGIVLVYPHPITGEMVYRNLAYGETIAAWLAAGFSGAPGGTGPVILGDDADINAIARPVEAVAAEVLAAMAAGAQAAGQVAQVDAAAIAAALLANDGFMAGLGKTMRDGLHLVQDPASG